MSTLCTCSWQQVLLDDVLEPFMVRAETNTTCPFPGHVETRIEWVDG